MKADKDVTIQLLLMKKKAAPTGTDKIAEVMADS